MQTSRILRLAAEKPGGFLLPPRTTMEMLASCANAVVNLFTNESERKRFTAAVNSGVIAPEVLGQANMSFVRILALHDELESPTLKKHGFDANEFLEGVKPALEQVHEVQAQLENKLRMIAAAPPPHEEHDKDEIEVEGMDWLSAHQSNDIKRLFRKKNGFEYVAKQDPDSYEARLLGMLSTWNFKAFELASKCSFIPTPPFQSHQIQVTNVALLSARGMVIDSEDTSSSDEITPQEKVVDNEGKAPHVAAQVEVLYDFEETIVVPDLDEAEETKDKTEDSDGTKTKTMTQKAVAVGVFEAWLSGGDEPEEGLRWKLAMMRHPDEFPLLNPHGTVSIQ